jgi:hypothetical protein
MSDETPEIIEVEPTEAQDAMVEAQAIPVPRRRGLLILVIAIILLATALIAALMLRDEEEETPEFTSRADPVLDLLGWLPAGEETSRRFAVWTPDRDAATPVSAAAALDLQTQLSLDPKPLTLGLSAAWKTEFGWEAGTVETWATAGERSELSVLTGQFDEAAIRERLRDRGYERSTHRGVEIFVTSDATPAVALGGDSTGAASVIAVLDNRLVTSSDRELVERAIDAAIDGSGSLADDATIAAVVSTLSPVSALVVENQSAFASECDPAHGPESTLESARSNYVVVGYGRLGAGGERRTLVALSYPDEAAAIQGEPAYADGWAEGFANAGGTGGSIASFGELTIVSRTGRIIVAELVNGRDDGWVRSGIRYALPVCEAAMSLAGAGTPVP